MKSCICYGILEYVIPFFVVTVEDVNYSGDGEGYMLIIPYQHLPDRVVREHGVDVSNHFGIAH